MCYVLRSIQLIIKVDCFANSLISCIGDKNIRNNNSQANPLERYCDILAIVA